MAPDDTETLTLALQGEHVSLAQFAAATTHFSALVAALSPPGLAWEIEDLEVGSTTLTARPVGERAGEAANVASAYLEVGVALERGDDLVFLHPAIKREAIDLVGVVGNGVEAVRFESRETEVLIFAPPAEPAPKPRVVPERSFGAVTGRAQTLTSRSRLRFTLYDLLSDRAVNCYVDETHEHLMADIWDKLVTVEGMVTRDPLSGRPLNIRRITSIVRQDPPAPGSYERARGARRRRPGEPRAEERMRNLRDGW